MTFSPRRVLCAMAVLSCVVTAGCESNNDEDKVRDKDLERIARRDRREQRERDRTLDRDLDPIVGRDRDRSLPRDRDRLDDRISDRAAERRPGMREIPADALAVDTGEGGRLQYEPNRDGVMYVDDADDDRVVYVGRIRGREQFRLDPEGNRALINDRVVFRSDLNPRHRYRLYFDAAR